MVVKINNITGLSEAREAQAAFRCKLFRRFAAGNAAEDCIRRTMISFNPL
jgi:hypothetical protein